MAAPSRATPADDRHRNEAVLVGKLAAPPQRKRLPSGDVAVSWRLIIDRPASHQHQMSRRVVDTVDCVTFAPVVQEVAALWQAGDTLEVGGALRRRFWRSAAGLASKCEVEVSVARACPRITP